MKTGRPTLPKEVKALKGTLVKSRELPETVEVTLVVDFPEPPEHLTSFAVDIWNKTIPELRDMGVLAKIDMELVTAYCVEMGRYNEANEVLRNKEKLVIKTKSGYQTINPWYTMARQSLKSALEIGSQFGITASSRSKIPKQTKPKGLDSILNGTGT